MKKSIFLLTLAISVAVPSLVLAKDDLIRHTKLEFGYAIGKDGQKKSLKGIPLTIRLVPVPAEKISPKNRLEQMQKQALKSTAFGRTTEGLKRGPLATASYSAPAAAPFTSEVYVADGGAPYFYMDPEEFWDPSSLDSLSMSGASGKLLESFKFGFHAEASTPRVLFRFKLFLNYNPSAPAGTSAFSNIIGPNDRGDAGFYIDNIPANNPGEAYIVTDINGNPVNIANYGLVFPSNTVHMAIQWREPHPVPPFMIEDGEGALNLDFYNLYSAQIPTVGSSADNFWYDWDPLDGVYTNEEFEVLGDLSGASYPSNFFMRIAVDSNAITDTLLPSSYTVVRGRNATGNFTNLWTSNDVYVEVQPSLFAQPGNPPLQVRFNSFAQAANALNMTFNVEAASLSGSSTQRILLWNYAQNRYDLKDTRVVSGTDTVTEVNVQTGASDYINPSTLEVQALVQYTSGTFTTSAWRGRWDRVFWTITR